MNIANIGKKIKHLRVEQNLSAGKLAKLSNIHTTTLSRIENGANNDIPLSIVDRIAKALGVTASWLVDDNKGYILPETAIRKKERSKGQELRSV